jgi:hypothetical protein
MINQNILIQAGQFIMNGLYRYLQL